MPQFFKVWFHSFLSPGLLTSKLPQQNKPKLKTQQHRIFTDLSPIRISVTQYRCLLYKILYKVFHVYFQQIKSTFCSTVEALGEMQASHL